MKEFIEELSKLLGNGHSELIEIELLLYKILYALSQYEFFSNNLLFKGGTCLIKNYLDYYRFSEDIDFTWRNQNEFKNKSRNQLRKYLSNLINKTGEIIEEISKENKLDFKNEKTLEKYFQFGGGNKMVTLKLYFISEVLNVEKFVKIQINFLECLKFEPKLGKLKSFFPENEELRFLYPNEYIKYSKDILFPIYNIKEILCEKIRAILTRRGTKARDFVDIYHILNNYDFTLEDLKNETIEKTLFVLNKYDKYKNNLKRKKDLIITRELFMWGEEKKLLLIEMDNDDFYSFVNHFNLFLENITDEIFKQHPDL